MAETSRSAECNRSMISSDLQQRLHLVVGRWRGVLDTQDPAPGLDRDTIEPERVDVDVQVQRAAAGAIPTRFTFS
jgi:hypothetical protein